MDNDAPRRGKTTIAPDVLVTIARLSALSVPGVARMAPVPVAVDRLFQRPPAEGVRIEVRQLAVIIDLYLVTHHDANVRDVCREVQSTVARAIQEMVGMHALAVNVYVEDVVYGEPPRPA
ncbi:MAG: Asp23/Gls24 family envelope stress response protein [Anaerolineales bacterium]|nr:Asp23/Gls24 family envelope stress response protein [Anaerolineales bacterium]